MMYFLPPSNGRKDMWSGVGDNLKNSPCYIYFLNEKSLKISKNIYNNYVLVCMYLE